MATTLQLSWLSFPTLLAVLFLFNFLQLVSASREHLPHSSYHAHLKGRQIISSSNSTRNSSSTDDAFAMVARAQKALGPANKKRIDNIRLNQYTFENPNSQAIAPPLDYNNTESLNSTTSIRRSLLSNSSSTPPTNSSVYSLPPELIEAARLVAESTPTIPDSSKQAALAAEVLAKYSRRVNDTNRMPQAIRKPDGLFVHASQDYEKVTYASNLTKPTLEKPNLENRGTSTWWMANIVQNGASPFAPPGYKGGSLLNVIFIVVLIAVIVWRNVLDYGAQGKFLPFSL